MSDTVRVLTDPNAIRRYQLRVVISAIKLETKGIKVNRRSVRVMWAKRFGLSSRVRPEVIIARLEEEIRELEKNAIQIRK